MVRHSSQIMECFASVPHKKVSSSVATAVSPFLLPRGLRIQQAAEYAGVSHWFLRSAIWTGTLKAHRAGKVLIILREDLDDFLTSLPAVKPSESEWLAKRQLGAAA
jgi:excisionase family DNA binding protein